jgi:short subunit dehydrogenase-like uncharacterized protein
MIVLYGATGYTGKLVIQELEDAGLEFVVAGRNEQKLKSIGHPYRVASVDDPASLRKMLDGAEALINCAGPFTHAGEPVVKAAVDAGVHYIDSTGESPYIQMVFDRYGAAAETKGIALIPACGFDYVPGDCIAKIAAAGFEPLDEIVLGYSVQGFGMSRGTLKSALEMMGVGPTKVVRASFDFGGDIGRQAMLPYPAGEPITVPRHTDVKSVTTLLSARTAVPAPFTAWAPYTTPLMGLAMKTPVRPLLYKAIAHLPEGPPEEARRAASWTIVAHAKGTDGRTNRAVVSGKDVYGLTARALVWAAERIGSAGVAGALGPAAAFDPEAFLAALADFSVRWNSEARRSREPVSTASRTRD